MAGILAGGALILGKGGSSPYKLPLYQQQIAAEFIFQELDFKEVNGCLIPDASTSFYEALDKCNIGFFANNGGYWQVTILNNYLSLTYLALFLATHKRPAIGTEILHLCNIRSCCAIGHIDEQPFQINIDMQQCYFIVAGDEMVKKCSCSLEKCCPVKIIYDESILTPNDVTEMRKLFLPTAIKPSVNRKFADEIWPCGICGRIFTHFILLWKHVMSHRRGRNLLTDPNCIVWTLAYENYNNLQVHEFITMETEIKKQVNRDKKRKERERMKKKWNERDAIDALVILKD